MATAEYMKRWRAKNKEHNAIVNRECVNRHYQRTGRVKKPRADTLFNAEIYRLRDVYKIYA